MFIKDKTISLCKHRIFNKAISNYLQKRRIPLLGCNNGKYYYADTENLTNALNSSLYIKLLLKLGGEIDE